MKLKLLSLLLMLAALPVAAGTLSVYEITWDTKALAAGYYSDDPTTIFYMGAQLVNGDGANGSSLLKLSDFQLGTGQAIGTPFLTGGAAGDVAGGIYLSDADFYNSVLQRFDPGDQFNFRLDVLVFPDGGQFPDTFNFALYYSTDVLGIQPIGTMDPLTYIASARVDLVQGPLPFETFDTRPVQSLDGSKYVPAPVLRQLTDDPASAPEPGTFGLLGLGFLGAGIVRRKCVRS